MGEARLAAALSRELASAEAAGTLKGEERVLTGYVPASGRRGPRWRLAGEEGRDFIRMNSNSYLGLSLLDILREAGEKAVRELGAGPGAVRFISGTTRAHVALEERLAAFHGREACMLFSAAYAAVMGVLAPLITPETLVVSDELNHNCIINAIRVGRPGHKAVTPHLSVGEVEKALAQHAGGAKRALVVTDGVFSMRGDCAPLDELAKVCRQYDGRYREGAVLVVDDSHGVGAFGERGRGTEEVTGGRADILLATLGKAFGVNGGYVVAGAGTVRYLREKSPFYVYSNPVTPGEAAAALAAVKLLDSPEGEGLLRRLRELRERFASGLKAMGWETLEGEHPIVPLMVRDTARTAELVDHLFEKGVLVTGLNYPVVPKGDEEIRFQISASLTADDVDEVLRIVEEFRQGGGGRGSTEPDRADSR